MDEHLYDNEFERFLQQQVKHHRMYPSDAVWKGIHRQMHGYKRWPGLYFFAIVIVAALTVFTIFIDNEPIVISQQVAKATTPAYDPFDPVTTTRRTIQKISLQSSDESATGESTTAAPATNHLPDLQREFTFSRSSEVAAAYPPAAPVRLDENLLTETMIAETTQEQLAEADVAKSNTATAIPVKQEEQAEEITTVKNPTDKYLEQNPDEAERILKQQARVKMPRWRLQFHISPSMNFREVVDEKPSSTAFNGPLASNGGANAEKVIRYKPGMGTEIGLGVMYSLNSRFRIKTGLQYNIRQFNIEAYSGSYEQSSIALSRGYSVDTMKKYTRFRSSGGYGEAELLNKYHQVSIPVGVEYVLLNSGRFGINLEGSLQPTWTFSQSSYLLTTDYKSYADGREVLRKWNLNSSLEIGFSYRTRKNTEWRFGPQLRYQHLPTYTDPYPIKEYLVDYGFKIGFTKTIQ